VRHGRRPTARRPTVRLKSPDAEADDIRTDRGSFDVLTGEKVMPTDSKRKRKARATKTLEREAQSTALAIIRVLEERQIAAKEEAAIQRRAGAREALARHAESVGWNRETAEAMSNRGIDGLEAYDMFKEALLRPPA
jgi:hypothetical protein